MKTTCDTATAKERLQGGQIFARAVSTDSLAGKEVHGYCWHIAMMYWSPYRPTLLRVKEVEHLGTETSPMMEVEVG